VEQGINVNLEVQERKKYIKQKKENTVMLAPIVAQKLSCVPFWKGQKGIKLYPIEQSFPRSF